MPKYKVEVVVTERWTSEVEAKDADEAADIATNASPSADSDTVGTDVYTTEIKEDNVQDQD